MIDTTAATAEKDAAVAMADIKTLEARADQLARDLEETRTQLREAHQRRAEAKAVLDARAREPRERAEYETITARLRMKLIEGPKYPGDFAARSPTRQTVKLELDQLEGDSRMSAADKLSRVKMLAATFADRRQADKRYFDANERR